MPAKDRIKQYKVITIKRTIPGTASGNRNLLAPAKSVGDFKIAPGSAKADLVRPTTAGFSQFGLSEAQTAESINAPITGA